MTMCHSFNLLTLKAFAMLLLNFFVTNAQRSISIHSGMSCVSLDGAIVQSWKRCIIRL